MGRRNSDDSDAWRRLREREDAEEREREKASDREEAQANRPGFKIPQKLDAELARIEELLDRAEPLIEQLENLYKIYLAGIEKRPPIERRTYLDRTMEMITVMAKPTRALQFRCNTLHARYVTHKDRWDKLLKAYEGGKTRR